MAAICLAGFVCGGTQSRGIEAVALGQVNVSTLFFVDLDVEFGQFLTETPVRRFQQPIMLRESIYQNHKVVGETNVFQVGGFCLSKRKGPFQTRVKQKPNRLCENSENAFFRPTMIGQAMSQHKKTHVYLGFSHSLQSYCNDCFKQLLSSTDVSASNPVRCRTLPLTSGTCGVRILWTVNGTREPRQASCLPRSRRNRCAV
jgi:hypothetical protein